MSERGPVCPGLRTLERSGADPSPAHRLDGRGAWAGARGAGLRGSGESRRLATVTPTGGSASRGLSGRILGEGDQQSSPSVGRFLPEPGVPAGPAGLGLEVAVTSERLITQPPAAARGVNN